MDTRLHREFDVTVVEVHPWGLGVELPDGTRGLIDNTKDPAWPSGDRDSVVGVEMHAVVVDDQRDPIRMSALEADLEIARAKVSSRRHTDRPPA